MLSREQTFLLLWPPLKALLKTKGHPNTFAGKDIYMQGFNLYCLTS